MKVLNQIVHDLNIFSWCLVKTFHFLPRIRRHIQEQHVYIFIGFRLRVCVQVFFSNCKSFFRVMLLDVKISVLHKK